MTEFRFAYPFVLLVLLLPLVVYFVPATNRRWAVPGQMHYSDTRLMKGLAVGCRVRLRWVPNILRLAAWWLLVVALARPQTGNAHEIIRGEGIDIVLALDISSSMAAVDFEPHNRLEAAKSVIADFISRREFDHIGLVVFARNAFHQAPPTLDYTILLQLLHEVALVSDFEPGEAHRMDGTAIGLGLASSANMLRHSQASSRVIILLTDGDNNAGIDPLQAASAVATMGIRIYAIGMGQPGQEGLNEDLLQEIATIGNGAYFQAANTTELLQIYHQIDRLERSEVERWIYVRWKDRAGSLLMVALCLLVTERVLRRTVFQTIP